MAIGDKGFGLKNRLQDAVRSTKEAVGKVDLSAAKEKLQETGNAAKEAAKKVKIPDVDAAGLKDVFRKNGKHREGLQEEQQQAGEKEKLLEISAVSTRSAVKIIYYLMAADGQIFHSEEEKFNDIGRELDPHFQESRDQIIEECQSRLDSVVQPEDYYRTLQEGVEEALTRSKQTADTFITPKMLVWNLLTIAFSDENYDESEKKLISYIVDRTAIDRAVFLEMESSILTLLDIENELQWIKTTNKPYLTIEAMVNELADRKNVIFESVKDLISL